MLVGKQATINPSLGNEGWGVLFDYSSQICQ